MFLNIFSFIREQRRLFLYYYYYITKFYNSDDVNVSATKLQLTKMRSTSFRNSTKFGMNASNEKLLNTEKFQVYIFYSF